MPEDWETIRSKLDRLYRYVSSLVRVCCAVRVVRVGRLLLLMVMGMFCAILVRMIMILFRCRSS